MTLYTDEELANCPPEYKAWCEKMAEHAPTFTLDQQIAEAKEEMGDKKWNELEAEWIA